MKNIIITGCSSGIGNAAAVFFSKHNHVIGLDNINTNIQVLNEFINIDCSDSSEVIAKTSHIKKVDILINCAGIIGKRDYITKLQYSNYIELLNNNFKSTLNMMKVVLPIMQNCRAGNIINLASILGSFGSPLASCYSVSKAAIIALTKTAAAENAELGIFINSISPATVDTPMVKELNSTNQKDYSTIYPIGHEGQTSDIVGVIDMLTKNKFITGQDFIIDGGKSNIISF